MRTSRFTDGPMFFWSKYALISSASMSRRSSSESRHFYVRSERQRYHDAREHVTMDGNLQQRMVGEPHAALERLGEIEHAGCQSSPKPTAGRCSPTRAGCRSRRARA